MIALYIILGIIAFLVLLSLLPISVFFEAKDEIEVIVRYGGIKVFDLIKSKEKKKPNVRKKSNPKAENETLPPKKQNKAVKLFLEKKEKIGIIGAIKYFGSILKIIFSKLIWFLRKLKFYHIKLDLVIASGDAAETAINYGSVCSVLYPLLSVITSNAKVDYQSINISADFNKTAISLDLSLFVKTRLLFAIIGILSGYKEYKKFVKEEEKNG